MLESENINNFKKNYKEYINTVIFPCLNNVEISRKKYLKYFIISVFISLFIVFGLIYLFLYSGMKIDDTAITITIVISLIIIPLIISFSIIQYNHNVKNSIMPQVMNFFEVFDHKAGNYFDTIISDEIIKFSGITPEYYEHFSNDNIQGTYQGILAFIEEADLYKKLYYSSSTRKMTTKKIYHGLLIFLEGFDRKFDSKTLIFNKKSKFIKTLRKNNSNLQMITINNTDFENSYEIYSNDINEAKKILTPDFMNNFEKLTEIFDTTAVHASFFENKVLISIENKNKFFEPSSLFKSGLDTEKIEKIFEEIIQIISMIEVLNLPNKTG